MVYPEGYSWKRLCLPHLERREKSESQFPRKMRELAFLLCEIGTGSQKVSAQARLNTA
jgi:hypothetical protein